jgi:hypothetical protein
MTRNVLVHARCEPDHTCWLEFRVVIDDDDKIMSAAPAYGMICEYPLSLILRQISDSLTPQ